MAVEIEQMTDDPILLATFNGQITLDDMFEVYDYTANIMQTCDGMVYRIHDIRESQTDFPTAMEIIKESNLKPAGSNIDERVQVIFVGRNSMTDVVRNAVSKYGRSLPVFDSIEAAVEAIKVGLIGR